MRHSVLVLLLGAGLLSGTASVAATAPEVVLHGGFHHGVALALDSSGGRHLVAAKGGGDLWYATDRSGEWASQRILAAEDGSFVWSNPTIATDDDGRVHIAAVRDFIFDTPGATGGIYYLTDKGRPRGDFGPTVRIAPPMMTSPSLKIFDDVRYLAYAKCLCLPGQRNAPVFFRTDRGGSWRVERITDKGFEPSLRVDANGRARIVFSDRMGLRYTRARTNVGDFTKPDRITGTIGLQGTPSLALDRAGRPLVAWSLWSIEPRVLYIRRSAAGWSTPISLGRGATTELSIDALGRPHAILGGQRIVHRWRTGGDWARSVLANGVNVMGVDIRGFGRRATIAWSQDVIPRGVWVVRD